MLCEECQKNEATFSVTITSGDEVTTRHLCGECMKKMELSLTDGDVKGFLSSILSMLGNAQTDTSPVCSGCGLHYAAFERTGKLGCAQCYHDFAQQLKPILQRIHGTTQHVGRTPKSGGMPISGVEAAAPEAEKSALQSRRDELRQKMDEAVACENFEDAAKYRDQLKLLPTGEEGEVKL